MVRKGITGGTSRKLQLHYPEKDIELAIAYAIGAITGKTLLEMMNKEGSPENTGRSWCFTRLAYAVRIGYLIKRDDK